MELHWFLSTHDTVSKVISNKLRDAALKVNTMNPITIKSHSVEKGFEKFINSTEFDGFTNNSISDTLYWYYYDDQDTLAAYEASVETPL